ncbi:uncharacterized protein LOC127181948 [Labeo rohita]|uniref:uncharacterized protein LOC127181948 n=1 Tax=Labeo rohita TaxID=84645 RepID=UPI0021E20F93|nr:uncharacterized protein LOC127181948 [Labeo rohita]
MGVLVILLLTLSSELCIADWTENLALGGKTVQSSTYDSRGTAQRAVDGNRNSDYHQSSCTHTQFELNPWWRVDLKDVYSVSRVIITNRGDCCQERIIGAEIRIGNSLENNGNNNELVSVIKCTPYEATQTFEFKPTKGRYVNIVVPGSQKVLTLCEVEVFAVKECSCFSKNLAVGAEAVQSSTHDTGAAQNAIDGSRLSNHYFGSCTHTTWSKDPWWRLDLKQVHQVTSVIITNRGDCCPEQLNGAQIRIGNSLENNGNNNELAATIKHIKAGATETFEFKPIKGRYVNIFLPGDGKILTLCEVEVFAGNLALGAKAVQSSTYNHLAGAEHAVDGSKESNFLLGSCTHTADNDPWWRVDLKEVRKVTRVSITNRGDCCEERIGGAQIRIGNSLENNGNNNELAATIKHIPAGATETFVFKPIRGRYVNIFLPGHEKYLTLCEVEVFAD